MTDNWKKGILGETRVFNNKYEFKPHNGEIMVFDSEEELKEYLHELFLMTCELSQTS